MSQIASVKRLRMCLEARDLQEIARTFRMNLSSTGLFFKSARALAIGTPVEVELTYANNEQALRGLGHVVWVRDRGGGYGVALDMQWDLDSHEATLEIEGLAAMESAHPARAPSLPPVRPVTVVPSLPPQPVPADAPAEVEAPEAPDLRLSQAFAFDELPPVDALVDALAEPHPAEASETMVEADLIARAVSETGMFQEAEPPPELAPRAGAVVAIDVGCSTARVAILKSDGPQALPSRQGAESTPAVVGYLKDGRHVVGEAALRQRPLNSENTVDLVPMLLGESYDGDAVERLAARVPFQILPFMNGDAAVMAQGKILRAETVLSDILKDLKGGASIHLHQELNRLVMTCPARFSERQKDALVRGANRAGFHVEALIAEPIAAALHFGMRQTQDEQRVLVYDLGGGAFEASLVHVKGDVHELVAWGAEPYLGGRDFDERVFRLLVKELKAQAGPEIASDPEATARLLAAAEKAKCELSERLSTTVRLEYLSASIGSTNVFQATVERGVVDRFFGPLVERTLAVCEDVCGKAGLAPADVDEVILVGGQSQTPIVQDMVRDFFGKEPRRYGHPLNSAVLGAAQFSATLPSPDDPGLISVLPATIGVGLPGGRFKPILEKSLPLPAERRFTIRTSRDNQKDLQVLVFEGEDSSVRQNDPVGTLRVRDLPAGPKGAVAVEVTFSVNGAAVLDLQAHILGTERKEQVRLATRATPAEHRPSAEQRRTAPPPRAGSRVPGWLNRLLG